MCCQDFVLFIAVGIAEHATKIALEDYIRSFEEIVHDIYVLSPSFYQSLAMEKYRNNLHEVALTPSSTNR